MKVEALFCDGCPGQGELLPRLRAVVDDVGAMAKLELRRTETAEHAAGERFLGAPTVRIDGEDSNPARGTETTSVSAVAYTVYPSRAGPSRSPREERIRAALHAVGGSTGA